jgi:mannose-6-phosphate isomerase-like protein (cupin superfamily)
MSKTPDNELTDPSNDCLHKVSADKYQPKSERSNFDFGIGSICLSGTDTWGKYCLLELGLAPGKSVPRHTHTREDEAYHVLSGELEVIVGEEVFLLKPGDTLVAPRGIPHQLRNSGETENHYLIIFSPSGFEEFVKATAVPGPNDKSAPTAPSPIGGQDTFDLAAAYGIYFDEAKNHSKAGRNKIAPALR